MNVLAVRQDNHGDVLLAGPALRALAASASRLTLLCGPSGRAAAEAVPGVDDVCSFEAGWIEAEPKPVDRLAIERTIAAVASRRIDRAVIFTSFHQSPLPTALVLRMAGVRWIAAISEDYPGSLLDVRHRNRTMRDASQFARASAIPSPGSAPTSSCTPARPCPRARGTARPTRNSSGPSSLRERASS
jgi:ADP-heptose:LPS heptosyltransferase